MDKQDHNAAYYDGRIINTCRRTLSPGPR